MTPRETELANELEACQQKLAAAEQLIALLRQKLDALARRLFGKSSEQLDPAQLELLLQLAENLPSAPAAPVAAQPEPLRSPKAARPARAPRLPEQGNQLLGRRQLLLAGLQRTGELGFARGHRLYYLTQ